MKRVIPYLVIGVLIFATVGLQADEKGGFVPCLATCLIGPRVGLEMNEGVEVYQSEWIMLGGQVLGGSIVATSSLGGLIQTATRAYNAYEMGAKKNGLEGGLASFFLGSRIGNELDYRKIRTVEWLQLVPCVCIYPAIKIPLEAYKGKTMSEIEVEEGLRK